MIIVFKKNGNYKIMKAEKLIAFKQQFIVYFLENNQNYQLQ